VLSYQVNTINEQGKNEDQPYGIVFGDMDNLMTILDLEPSKEGGEEEPEFDDDDASYRSYLPKDDNSALSGDHSLPEYHQDNQPEGYHEDQGVGGGNDDDPGVDDDSQPQDEDEDLMLEELNVVE
jgi:hypothetical protein